MVLNYDSQAQTLKEEHFLHPVEWESKKRSGYHGDPGLPME